MDADLSHYRAAISTTYLEAYSGSFRTACPPSSNVRVELPEGPALKDSPSFWWSPRPTQRYLLSHPEVLRQRKGRQRAKGKGKASAKETPKPPLDPDEEKDRFTEFISMEEGARCRRKVLADIYDCETAGTFAVSIVFTRFPHSCPVTRSRPYGPLL